MKQLKNKHIVLFDGVCNLCNSSVQFIIKHDKKELFLFASQQSDAAKELLLQFPSKKNDLDSILYIENGILYHKSTAALKIARLLKFPINCLYICIILPLFIRDSVYNYISKNRYKWFGKKENCMIPTEKDKNKFI